MNILYIGPYKNKNSLYNTSLDIIHELSNHKDIKQLHVRPIYINSNSIQENKDLIVKNLSNRSLLSHYDIIIQHCPVTMITNTCGLCDKSIVIPLLNKTIGSNRYQKQLEDIDLVLTDSSDWTDFLVNYYHVNANTFSYSGIYSTQNNINFSVYENTTKIYSIYESYHADILSDTLTAFYETFIANDNISLIFVLSSADKNIIGQLNTDFDKIKNKLGIKSNIFNIQIMIKDFSFEELCAIHKRCDLYIDLEKSNLSSKIHRYIASQMNKKVITDKDIQNDIAPAESTRGVFTPKTSLSNLISTMQNALSTNNISNFNTYPNIGSFICQ